MTHIYGIPNCDTVKKALSWLKENNISYTFHDFKKEELSEDKINYWLSIMPLDKLVNKKSTAWKNFTETEQKKLDTTKGAVELIQLNTNFIKRPVLEIAGTVLSGFNEETYNITSHKS